MHSQGPAEAPNQARRHMPARATQMRGLEFRAPRWPSRSRGREGMAAELGGCSAENCQHARPGAPWVESIIGQRAPTCVY